MTYYSITFGTGADAVTHINQGCDIYAGESIITILNRFDAQGWDITLVTKIEIEPFS